MITMVGCVSGRMSSEFLERYNPTLLKMKILILKVREII